MSIELLTAIHPETGELITEEFRPVKGYEGLYEVSSFGRIKSLIRQKVKNERLRKQSIDSTGYYTVTLCKGNPVQYSTFKVHIIVAIAFHNHNPGGYSKIVNHIDFNPLNNRSSNLNLITTRQNTNRKHIKHSSRYTGVSRYGIKWVAKIQVNGRRKHLGTFIDEIDAHEAYQKALKST